MADRKLNLEAIKARMAELGLSASNVAKQLGVSRAIVSEWINGKKTPRPRILFELGMLLDLKISEVLLPESSAEPIVAYRKRSNSKPDLSEAVEMGKALEHLVDYLPFNKLQSPPGLLNPNNSHDYIESAADEIRKTLDGDELVIDVDALVKSCRELKIVLVPVLWGEKDRKYNALSVFLPKSRTNWVFLNLDVKPMDFKFWILHEMIHAMVRGAFPSNSEEEQFCDALAGAVLVPADYAERLLDQTLLAIDTDEVFKPLLNASRLLIVSPITLAHRVDAIAKSKGRNPPFGNTVFAVCENFNKEFGLVSEAYFESIPPSAEDLIRVSEAKFGTYAYKALGSYLKVTGASEGAVAAMLGLSAVDAKAVYHALVG
ncbi:MAG: helix-turn-helix transcriptional regulator [Candidatus Hydrogenedentales bacterium]